MDFAPYQDRISVVESRMNTQPADMNDNYDKSPHIFVIVVLTNKSDIAWKDIQMDFRFFNKSGTFIDAQPRTGYGTICPNGESAFRVKLTPSRELSEYDSYKISVKWARGSQSFSLLRRIF
jgi:hypothetical protein